MANDLIELRRHLFETLKALRDEKNPMDLDRARAVAQVAQTIINSGRLECDYLEILGGEGTGFCDAAHDAPKGKQDGLRLLNGRGR